MSKNNKSKEIKNFIFRGELYYVDLDPSIGSEQGGIRPIVVLQNNIGNKYSPTVLVAPIISKTNIKKKLPTHVLIKAFGDIRHNSLVLLEQTRVIDKTRLRSYLGRLNEVQLSKINKALLIALDIK